MSYRYILFYKPYNVLCQFTDHSGIRRQTLQDYITLKDVYPVGRLDRDSEGLLLLTNHGVIQHRLSHPRFGHGKTYWVQVEGESDDRALQRLRNGVIIQNYRTRSAQVERLLGEPELPPRTPPIRFRKTVPTSWLSITLTEGRNRQIRRMTAAVGLPTLRLIRVALQLSLGQRSLHLNLKGLSPGEGRELQDTERQVLLELLS